LVFTKDHLSERGRVVENFAKLLKITRNYTVEQGVCKS